MFFRSIRFKIILWYMLILTLTLTVFSVFAYQNFKVNLYKDTDNRLGSRAEGIAEAIDTYWETEKIEAREQGVSVEALTKINNADFLKIAQHWIEEKSYDPKLLNIMVEVYDPEGQEIARSKNIPKTMALPKEAWETAWEGEDYAGTAFFSLGEAKPQPYRIFVMPVIENARMAYIVQVASPFSALAAALAKLRTILFLLLPLTVFLTGVVGAFFAKLALRPVESMIHTAYQITGENLNSRIHVPDTKDEIQRLAETFNEMLERLSRAFAFQQHFIQDVAHEFKTPLTILKGYLEVALKKARSPQEYESLLASNLEEINKLTRITNDLLTLARFDSRQIQLDLVSCDLCRLIEDVVSDIRVLAEQKKIRLSIACREALVVSVDESQVKRVFLNILDNAIKYTAAGGEVTLALDKEAGFAKIRISDTGSGIPSEDLPYIFDRFYRVDKARSSPGGFGLGLSITKSILEAHRGAIGVESVFGKGTTFMIRLPLGG